MSDSNTIDISTFEYVTVRGTKYSNRDWSARLTAGGRQVFPPPGEGKYSVKLYVYVL